MEQVDGISWNGRTTSPEYALYVTAGEFQYPQPEELYLETTYDLATYCPRCGIGACQKAPFRLRRDFKQKRAHFLGLFWVHDEVFAREIAVRVLGASGLTGLTYSQPCIHTSGIPIEDLHQLRIEAIAPAGLLTDGLRTVVCREADDVVHNRSTERSLGTNLRFSDIPYCGRVKYHFPLAQTISFHKEALVNLPDFAKSAEYFGSGGGATRLILVRQRVVRAVKEAQLRGLKFTPLVLL